jgi:p-hydroxybenzoate 3-monooxygenase
MRTQVGIVGAGPAGLLLSHLLRRAGIESVIVENRSRAYCEARVRAGLLEHGSTELLRAVGLGERLDREGMLHDGVVLRVDGESHRIAYGDELRMTIYGQQEVVRDLNLAHERAGTRIVFDASEVAVHDLASDAPRITFRDAEGTAHELACDYIAGCDGFHGVTRPAIPAGALQFFDRVYPFAWLGILATAPPLEHDLVYVRHERGFALFTMRSHDVARHYIQCTPDTDAATWSDAAIWAELRARLGTDGRHTLVEGDVIQKGVTAMRSFVTEPMRFGNLFLTGDAAHIVPPTGAKGMNLAIADVVLLASAFANRYADGDTEGLDRYSAVALERVWKIQRFSWWMTAMLHRFDDAEPFDERVRRADLDLVTQRATSRNAFVEQYAGMPFATFARDGMATAAR